MNCSSKQWQHILILYTEIPFPLSALGKNTTNELAGFSFTLYPLIPYVKQEICDTNILSFLV